MAHQRAVQAVPQAEERDETGRENHGAVVGVLAEGRDAFASAPLFVRGAADPDQRKQRPQCAGRGERQERVASERPRPQEVVSGPEHEHALQQQGEELHDLPPVVRRDEVGGHVVAAVQRRGKAEHVQIDHEGDQGHRSPRVARAWL